MSGSAASSSKTVLSITTIILLLNAVIFGYAAFHSMLYLGDLTTPEGAVVYSVKGLLTGSWPLYRDYTLPPYSATPYTPLFYLVSALVAWITTKSVYAIYICCRFITLSSTIGAAFFVGRIASLLAPSVLRSTAFLLPFTILTLMSWGYSARPDMLAILLSLAGMYTYLRNQQSLAGLFQSALIFALAWWCKQSFIAAPAAVFLALLCAHEWKRCAVFSLAYSAAIIVLIAATQYLSHGWFLSNIITANITELKPDLFWGLVGYGYFYLAPFIAVVSLLTCITHFAEIKFRPPMRCIALYLLLSVLISTAACMKEGAYFNYMIEPLFVASIMAVLGIHSALKYKYTAILMPLLLLISLVFSYHYYWFCDGALHNALWADMHAENTKIQSVIDKIDGLSGDVLTSKSVLAVRSAKPVLATDLFNVRYLEQAGKLSTQALAERINHKELAAIVASEGCQPSDVHCMYWPPRIQHAIVENYEPHETLYNQVFWYPKP